MSDNVGFTEKDNIKTTKDRDNQQKLAQHRDETSSVKTNANRRRSSSSVTTIHHHHSHSHLSQDGKSNGLTGFLMRPNLQDKFDRRKVEAVMEEVIREFMRDKQNYSADEADDWTEQISQLVNQRVKQLNFPRYKICSLITIGEHIGGGIHIGMKCLWDAETDVYANYSYVTDTLFVVGTVCGIFYY